MVWNGSPAIKNVAGRIRRASIAVGSGSTSTNHFGSMSSAKMDVPMSETTKAQRKDATFPLRGISPVPTQTAAEVPANFHMDRYVTSRTPQLSHVAESGDFSSKFMEGFFGLPAELIIDILCMLTFEDIMVLRLTSYTFYIVLEQYKSPLVHNLIQTCKAVKLGVSIYPPPQAATWTSFFHLMHRATIIHKLTRQVAEFIMLKIKSQTTERQRLDFSLQFENIMRNAEPLLFSLFRFFESFCATLANSPDELVDSQYGEFERDRWISRTFSEEQKATAQYSTKRIFLVSCMYELLMLIVDRKLRPPTYAGKLERAFRGWHKRPASNEEIVQMLFLGGLETVKTILDHESYGTRRWALDQFLKSSLPSTENDEAGASSNATRANIALISKESESSILRAASGLKKQRLEDVPREIQKPRMQNILGTSKIELDRSKVSKVCVLLPKSHTIWRVSTSKVLEDAGLHLDDEEWPTTHGFIEWLMDNFKEHLGAGAAFVDDRSSNNDNADLDGLNDESMDNQDMETTT
ncbi:hypothetical protein MMC20_007112 [Loxospora ochrophaea]|nr:hypothetical protein [Loxospora ochrophaea]